VYRTGVGCRRQARGVEDTGWISRTPARRVEDPNGVERMCAGCRRRARLFHTAHVLSTRARLVQAAPIRVQGMPSHPRRTRPGYKGRACPWCREHARPLHAARVRGVGDTRVLSKPCASGYRGRTRHVADAHGCEDAAATCRASSQPCASATCRVRPLYPGRARLGETRVSPTPRTRAAWRGRACSLHHGHARPCTRTRAAWMGGASLYPDGRGLDKTRAVWRGRARCGKDARVSYTPRTSSPRRSGLLHGARVSLKSNLCPLHPVPVFYNLRPSYTPPIHRARRVEHPPHMRRRALVSRLALATTAYFPPASQGRYGHIMCPGLL